MEATAEWLAWLENSTLSAGMRQWVWFYPLIETLHILGLAVFFGAVAMFDLRLLGCSRQIWVTDLAQHLLPWAYLSFVVVAISGFLMFAMTATEIGVNSAFQLKLLLILAAAINAVVFHLVPFRSVLQWNRGSKVPLAAQTIAAVSLVLWAAVIVCGRWIAYV
ncbi:hypothetical protein IFO70_22445 [Phormidium tenue FACHB-886]|nr:hypothetical protein [Phormidium tenue FACHB-886]